MTDYNKLLQDLKNEPKEDFTNNQSVDINILNKQVNEYMSNRQGQEQGQGQGQGQGHGQGQGQRHGQEQDQGQGQGQRHGQGSGKFTIERKNNGSTACHSTSPEDCKYPYPYPPTTPEKFVVDNFTESTLQSSTDLLTFKPIILAVTFIAAMAWNDTIKFFISRSIKMHAGSPLYYIYYSLLMTLVAVLVIKFL
jgi:hypothetical protein